jgi:deoxyribodipyrimidine photo-lyase
MWFRRDLRVEDNAALHAALTAGQRVYCVFVFDTGILATLDPRANRRVEFLHECVAELRARLREAGGELIVRHGVAEDEIDRLAAALKVKAVYANRDYEPAAKTRDAAIAQRLAAAGIAFNLSKDQTVFEQDEVLTGAGKPFTVFTPYKNAWLKHLGANEAFFLKPYPVEKYLARLAPPSAEIGSGNVPTLEQLGFQPSNLKQLAIPTGTRGAQQLFDDFKRRMKHYRDARDYPAVKGTSYLSAHLRFGTISIRALAAAARKAANEGAATWLSELIWRDFYFMVLHHHPHVVGHAFKREYEDIAFPNDKALFAAWCEGRTGYPIVDAGMRQLNHSGYMHNRLRMIVASFLVKDLHCDWRWGERYFATHLTDHDLAANNGGWQWAASTGCDAQPYFRILNPVTQSERFDAEGKFIRRYVPELSKVDAKHIHAPWLMSANEQQRAGCVIGRDYPAPVVDHAKAREVALALFKKVK